MLTQKTRRKRSKTTAIFFVLLFIVVTFTVWLTMALLTARSDDTRNTFTLGKGVDLILEEPKFSELIKLTDGKKNFSPGDVIDKDPTISIGENGLDEEYIAATVFYYIDKNGDGIFSDNEQVSYSEFKTYASIGTYIDGIGLMTDCEGSLGSNWFTIDDYQTFFYGTGTEGKDGSAGAITSLIPFEKRDGTALNTTTLFNKVIVASGIPLYATDTALYKKGQPVSFQIWVKAYAVQAGDGIVWQQAALDFCDSFGLNIGTTDTTINN